MTSIIKVNNIQNSSGTAAMAIDGSSNVTFPQSISVTGAISGTDMQLLHTTTVTSNVGEVVIDGHFTSAFKNYKVIGSNVHLDTDDKN